MRYQFTSPGSQSIFGGGRPSSTIIRSLLIINIGIWALLALSGVERFIFPLLGLVPRYVWSNFLIWQPLTYMFLHAGFWHVGMNMFVLWMFGSELERDWGGAAFLRYYLITGAGAGLVTVLFSLGSTIPVVGASGAIYGVLLAYGLAYPNREVYLYFMFPVKVKYFVGFLAIVAFFASLQPGTSTVSHLTHLSGMLIGWAYLKSGWSHTGLSWRERVARYQAAHRARRSILKDQEEEYLHRQVDHILDKINREGYASLTKEEQEQLFKASLRFSSKKPRD